MNYKNARKKVNFKARGRKCSKILPNRLNVFD